MLTRLRVKNFKGLAEIDIELGQTVVFIGPNNSGKTSALQALALWSTGVQAWNARRSGGAAKERTGVTVNRRALTHTPVVESRDLWYERRVQGSTRSDGKATQFAVFIEIVVDGQTGDRQWSCALEFQHAGTETIYCRPSRNGNGSAAEPNSLPDDAVQARVALLPPMSGLATEEAELQLGRIQTLIGEGRTAEVLRNLCLRVASDRPADWEDVCRRMKGMFGAEMEMPQRDPARGIVEMGYSDTQRKVRLDLTSAGRGQLQTLLLLSYLYANPGAMLLLDEPDAHLEIIRQRRIYDAINDVAHRTGSQIVAASHSEIILQEAAQRDVVVAFVGPKPHRIDDRGTQVVKSLKDIGFDQYYLATHKKFVLYVEGATDLEFLRGFARAIAHPVTNQLDDVFVHYVANQPGKARDHFFGLKLAEPRLQGFALFDRLDILLNDTPGLPMKMWQRREIENYVTNRELLIRFVSDPTGEAPDDLVQRAESTQRTEAMTTEIDLAVNALRTLGKDAWSTDFKVSDEFLTPLFQNYYRRMGSVNAMSKTNFHRITNVLKSNDIDSEIREVLDSIYHQIQLASES